MCNGEYERGHERQKEFERELRIENAKGLEEYEREEGKEDMRKRIREKLENEKKSLRNKRMRKSWRKKRMRKSWRKMRMRKRAGEARE